MVPKDKSWGMSNLGLWGKNPCFSTFVLFATFLVLPNLSNLFNVLTLLVGGSYCMGERGHGKTWVWQAAVSFGQYACPAENSRFPHAGLHSPHGRFLSRLVSSPSRAGWNCMFGSSSHTSRGSSLVCARSKKVERPQEPEFSWYVSRPWFLIHDFYLLLIFTHDLGCCISSTTVGCCRSRFHVVSHAH